MNRPKAGAAVVFKLQCEFISLITYYIYFSSDLGQFLPPNERESVILLPLRGIQDHDPLIAKSCVQCMLFITFEKGNMQLFILGVGAGGAPKEDLNDVK